MQGPAEARGKTMRNILSFSVKDVSLALVAWQQIDDIVERERGERERACWRSVQLAGEGWGNCQKGRSSPALLQLRKTGEERPCSTTSQRN